MSSEHQAHRRALLAALPVATSTALTTLATLGAFAPTLRAQPATTASPAAAGGWDLAALAALLAQRRNGEARFTEERFVAAFDSPLRSAGVLSFTAPDRFARHTQQPRDESMEVAGNVLTLRRGGRTRQMTLDAMPELAALLEAVRGTLSGDAATLRRHFDVQVGGAAAMWTLALRPRDSQLAAQVRSVQMAGQGAELRSVELLLAGGDRSLMLIEPLQRTAPPPAAARPARP